MTYMYMYFTVIFARKRTCIETRTPKICFKMQRKVIPFSTHVNMFNEVSKTPWRLCLCYNVYPTQTIPYRTGRLLEMNYKISSKTNKFLEDQEISRF